MGRTVTPQTAREGDWASIADAFPRGFRSRHELGEGRRKIYGRLARLHRKRLRSIFLSQAPTPRQRDVVAAIYSREYEPSTAEFLRRREKRRDVFLVHGRPLSVDGWFTFEYRVELLERALAAAGARKVLEVGSGRGILLALLALRRPDLELTGVDLVPEAIARSRELALEPPTELLSLAGVTELTPEREDAISRIRFVEGDAAHLPFEDGEFDVSYTCLALEQMPQSVPEAVQEMARVTRGHCVFLEPFADANGVLGRAQLRRLDYFRGPSAGFTDLGLEPVYFTAAIPQKVRFKTGLLVTRLRS